LEGALSMWEFGFDGLINYTDRFELVVRAEKVLIAAAD
jgi:hypothetical protein